MRQEQRDQLGDYYGNQTRDDSVWGQNSSGRDDEMWLEDLEYIQDIELVRLDDGWDVGEGTERNREA